MVRLKDRFSIVLVGVLVLAVAVYVTRSADSRNRFEGHWYAYNLPHPDFARDQARSLGGRFAPPDDYKLGFFPIERQGQVFFQGKDIFVHGRKIGTYSIADSSNIRFVRGDGQERLLSFRFYEDGNWLEIFGDGKDYHLARPLDKQSRKPTKSEGLPPY